MSYASLGAGFSFEASASTSGGAKASGGSTSSPSTPVLYGQVAPPLPAAPARTAKLPFALPGPKPLEVFATVKPPEMLSFSMSDQMTSPAYAQAALPTGPAPSDTDSRRKWIMWGGAALLAGAVVVWAVKRKKPAAKMTPNARRRSVGDFALVRDSGMDTWVVSTHKTKAAAEAAMRKLGGEPDSMFQRGMRIVNVGPSGGSELIEVLGKLSVRPRMSRNRRKRRKS